MQEALTLGKIIQGYYSCETLFVEKKGFTDTSIFQPKLIPLDEFSGKFQIL
jgi:hypothetical protein